MINYRLLSFLTIILFFIFSFVSFSQHTVLLDGKKNQALLIDTTENDVREDDAKRSESVIEPKAEKGLRESFDLPVKSQEIQKDKARRAEEDIERFSFGFDDIAFRVNNIDYYYLRDGLEYKDEDFLFFRVTHNRPIAEVRIYPEKEGLPFKDLRIIPSADFEVIDSLVFLNNEYHRTRIRFNDLRQIEYPSLILSFWDKENNIENRQINLYPYFVSSVIYDREPIELFRGEEKAIDLPATNVFNIRATGESKKTGDFEYRITRSGSNLRLMVKAYSTGYQQLPLVLKTVSPWVNEAKELTHLLDTINLRFNVKPSRLPFVNIDKDYIFYDYDRRRGEEIRLDYLRDLQLRQTYRIENQQEPGGTLIAELHVKSYTTDNKILAEIRPYDYHRVTDGYLYIKEGERTIAMTNFNIISRPEISEIEIMREGQEWTSNLTVYPGESIEVKIEGRGLMDVDVTFDGCRQELDKERISDRVKFYDVKVPVDITRRQIMIFLNKEITQHELRVSEYQRPADLDFVMINYGEGDISITDKHYNRPVFYSETIKDINIVFEPDKIDREGRLNGKQYLNIEVRILDENNNLLDIQTISNVVVCPGENSPRHAFYSQSDCNQLVIRLNEHLLRNTYLLDAFSQIVITVKHNENRYNMPAVQERRANIFIERKRSFDIMVSFPTGLLVKEFQQPGIGNLSGISTSVLAEISFYDPQRIGQKRPYKIGAGFIALNAFNFRESPDIRRDIGIVVIGSIEPVRTGAKFSFPIYLGMGYLLDQGDFFAIFGPGIRLHF